MTDQAIPQHQRERKRQNHSNYEFKKKTQPKSNHFICAHYIHAAQYKHKSIACIEYIHERRIFMTFIHLKIYIQCENLAVLVQGQIHLR